MARYKLSRKRNRLNAEKDNLWYAEPTSTNNLDTRETCRYVTKHTTLSPFELSMGLDMLFNRLPEMLAQGNTVQAGRLGTFRVEFGSEGVAQPEDFNYHLIRKPRVIFQPSKELQRAVASAMFYELDGVVEGGFGFADIASYRNWQAGKLNANTKDKEI